MLKSGEIEITNPIVFEPSVELRDKLFPFSDGGGFQINSSNPMFPFEAIRGQIVRLMEDGTLNSGIRTLSRQGTGQELTLVEGGELPLLGEERLNLWTGVVFSSSGRTKNIINLKCLTLDGVLVWQATLRR